MTVHQWQNRIDINYHGGKCIINKNLWIQGFQKVNEICCLRLEILFELRFCNTNCHWRMFFEHIIHVMIAQWMDDFHITFAWQVSNTQETCTSMRFKLAYWNSCAAYTIECKWQWYRTSCWPLWYLMILDGSIMHKEFTKKHDILKKILFFFFQFSPDLYNNLIHRNSRFFLQYLSFEWMKVDDNCMRDVSMKWCDDDGWLTLLCVCYYDKDEW